MTDGVTHQPSRRFIVRLWSATVDGVGERRGEVRDLDSGAFAAFREWSSLVGFLDEQLHGQTDEERPSTTRRHG
jgi:hypothetical protein